MIHMPVWTCHGETIHLFGLKPLHFSNIARNGNLGSIWAYQIIGGFQVTGLIEVFLKLFFRITDYPVPNSKQGIVCGEKPACLFPIGWPIGSQMGCSMWKGSGPFFVVASFQEGSRSFIIHGIP
jgi:hypothetical protein